ncbi:MAG: hypothetical protein ACO1SX_04740 [Actinomycetota bacterium]
MPWVYDPHYGGVKVPPAVQRETARRIRAYAAEHNAGQFTRLDMRFRGAFCYVDAFIEPREPSEEYLNAINLSREEYLERMRNLPTHLVRLRYFGDIERWSMAFFTYSNERYEPCMFRSGKDHGTPEEAFEIGSVYLRD